MGDLEDRVDVELLVRSFYRTVLADDVLAPVFRSAEFDLERHLPVMIDFWTTVLFRSGEYRGNPLAVHVDLHRRVPPTQDHFDRWLALWAQTADELFAGERADAAKAQATRIGSSIARHLRGESGSEYVEGLTVRSA